MQCRSSLRLSGVPHDLECLKVFKPNRVETGHWRWQILATCIDSSIRVSNSVRPGLGFYLPTFVFMNHITVRSLQFCGLPWMEKNDKLFAMRTTKVWLSGIPLWLWESIVMRWDSCETGAGLLLVCYLLNVPDVLCKPWRRWQCCQSVLFWECFEWRLTAPAAAAAAGLQGSPPECDRLPWQWRSDEASSFTLLACERSWKETSMWTLFPIPWPDLGALSAAPASHTAFGDHSVDYQQDSKCLSLYRPCKGF